MDSARDAKRLYRVFREGPNSDDGTLVWFIGMIIWWRMLAISGLLGVAGIAVMWIGHWVGEPVFAALAGLFVGLWVGGWTKHLSPKYNVTKNY